MSLTTFQVEMNTSASETFTSDPVAAIDIYSYLEMKVAHFLLLYISPVIILFGTLGNILSLVVLQSRHYKSSPTSIALSALALADIGVLNTGLLRHWIKTVAGIDVRSFGNISCKIHAGFTYLTGVLSGNILAITSMERVISVWFPLKVRNWITKQRMLVAVVLVSTVYLLCHVPFFITMHVRSYSTKTYCGSFSSTFYTIWHWASMVMKNFVPIVAIFICNLLIIIGLQRAAINRKKNLNKEDKKTSSTTVMLVVVGVVYLLTVTPGSIHLLGESYGAFPSETIHDKAKYELTYAITQQLKYVNSAINFLLYCCTGTKFRKALRKLFDRLIRKDKKDQSNGTLSNTSKVSEVQTNAL